MRQEYSLGAFCLITFVALVVFIIDTAVFNMDAKSQCTHVLNR